MERTNAHSQLLNKARKRWADGDNSAIDSILEEFPAAGECKSIVLELA